MRISGFNSTKDTTELESLETLSLHLAFEVLCGINNRGGRSCLYPSPRRLSCASWLSAAFVQSPVRCTRVHIPQKAVLPSLIPPAPRNGVLQIRFTMTQLTSDAFRLYTTVQTSWTEVSKFDPWFSSSNTQRLR
ncbi:hypothetical protein VTK26DRAFT_333 [Humicola hyalothermophila]